MTIRLCKHGHPMTEENTYVSPKRTSPECRTCRRKRDARYYTGRRSTEERFFDRVKMQGDCWIYQGVTPTGYGNFCVGPKGKEKYFGAHRWAYEFLRAEIPEGLHLDHLCRTPACVNPWHLEPVTQRENVLRMWAYKRGTPRVTL